MPGFVVGRPVAFLSQTMGPSEHPQSLRRQVDAITCQSGAWPRRALCQECACSWHPLCQIHTGPFADHAARRGSFGSNSPRLQRWVEAINKRTGAAGSRGAGITPNTIVAGRCYTVGVGYSELIVATMVDLHHRGFPLVLIPHSFRTGTKRGHNNDTQLCSTILGMLPHGIECLYVEEDLTSQELRLLVSKLELLLASRFHSMVSALSVGVPPITLGWGEQKYIEVSRGIRCARAVSRLSRCLPECAA